MPNFPVTYTRQKTIRKSGFRKNKHQAANKTLCIITLRINYVVIILPLRIWRLLRNNGWFSSGTGEDPSSIVAGQ